MSNVRFSSLPIKVVSVNVMLSEWSLDTERVVNLMLEYVAQGAHLPATLRPPRFLQSRFRALRRGRSSEEPFPSLGSQNIVSALQ